jgi:hypothetical protein
MSIGIHSFGMLSSPKVPAPSLNINTHLTEMFPSYDIDHASAYLAVQHLQKAYETQPHYTTTQLQTRLTYTRKFQIPYRLNSRDLL